MSRYDGTDTYTYPDSQVLKNRANIREQGALDAFEADATAVRMLQIAENPITGNFDLLHLQAIHRFVFQDICDWAGELRTVDISKGESRFANWPLIEGYLGGQLQKLAAERYLKGLAPELFVQKIAYYMGEINAAHPFREGNGRVQRIFCAQLAEQAGYFIGFEDVSQEAMYSAMIASFNGDETKLIKLLDSIVAIIE